MIQTAKLPNTIYQAIIDECLTAGERRFPIELAINEFISNGYGREKAKKWVFEMAKVNGDRINEPWINIEKC